MSSKLLMVSQGHSKTAVHITAKVIAVSRTGAVFYSQFLF